MRDGGFLDPRGLGLAPGLGAGGPASFDALGFRGAFSGDGRSALRAGLAWVDGFVPAARGALQDQGPLSVRRQRPSGGGRADGIPLGEPRRARDRDGPRFDQRVPPGGYAWWYCDAISDDGAFGLTIIGFVGSVFSPYYKITGRGRPENHAAINVALYGRGARRWAMTERGEKAVSRGPSQLQVGPSAMHWDGHCLTIEIDEVTPLLPKRVRGTVKLHPQALLNHPMPLDRHGRHCWWPIAPCARVEADFSAPNLSWRGHGYLDFNTGAEPLEASFSRWNWSRASVPGGTAVLYDLRTREGEDVSLAILFDPKSGVTDFAPPPKTTLITSVWRMARETRSEDRDRTVVLKTLEDSPFYARSLVKATLFGERTVAMHESLDLDRFRNPIVQSMLPYRMPRRFF